MKRREFFNDRGETATSETVVVDAWMWDALLSKHLGAILFVVGMPIICGVLALAILYGTRVWRVSSTAEALDSVQADYAWLHQTGDVPIQNLPQWSRQEWAERLGNRFVSDIASVRIRRGDPDDEQLDFVERLPELRSFELRSNAATDETLAVLSKLPNLRYLTLIGKNFSITGLLQLRAAPELEQLRFDTQRYSAIELAVLKSELPGVELYDTGKAYQPYFGSIYSRAPAI